MLDKLFKFNGGVHPPEHKLESTGGRIRLVATPPRLVLPLRQHVGNIPKLCVSVGDHVLKGQLLAEPEGMISAAVHASASGTIAAIDEQPIPHPSGLPDLCVTLETDGAERWIERSALNYRALGAPEIIARLRMAGIVGLGGAAFPSHVKLRADKTQPVRILILNGSECEPYITCDDMLMRERAIGIVRGLEIMRDLLNAKTCLIGVEDNKPQAVDALRAAINANGFPADVVVVPTRYPSGGAKQLIRLLTGLEVPSGGLPTAIGAQCFNVGTAYSLHRYIDHGEPVLSRVVTVTGNVKQPGNFEVPIGTPVSVLIEAAGGTLPDTDGIIMGGPMMGFSLPDNQAPVVKATNCIIASAPTLFPPQPVPLPCIRCASCANACPANLQPQELYWFARSQNLDKAHTYHVFDCIECGCCSYVCPSHIPLVQYYRYAKSEIIARDRARQSANIARGRNEQRLARLERDKLERAQRHAQKQGAEAKADNATDDEKQAIIRAAMERTLTQKETTEPQNVDNLPLTVRDEIAEIDARREQLALTEKQEP